MGIVVGINGERIDPLDESLRVQLSATGSAVADVDTLTVSPARWRAAARAAARSLGRPVKTIAAGHHLHAILTDWPADDREQQIHDAALRAVVDAIASPISVPPDRWGVIPTERPAVTDMEPTEPPVRGKPLSLASVPKWDLEIDFDFVYDGTFTVRSSRGNAVAVAASLREYVADHGYQPYVLLGPEQDPDGQFVLDRIHAHLFLHGPNAEPDYQASDYIGEVSSRTARRLFEPMAESLSRGMLPALPARISGVLPLGTDGEPAFVLTVNRRRRRASPPQPAPDSAPRHRPPWLVSPRPADDAGL
ncbi:hypothetical protein MZK47_08875 [Microbacterium aerolatum]|uniref:hypothetical protein n=1 Tax=Microbacterium aerolatum TaxID=153731 RepID=UPI002001A309|nr:hypothetical protein [Microbacterium aerolatum]MCK3769779.1 hypothetical protein [Microbacterium aerolatum]